MGIIIISNISYANCKMFLLAKTNVIHRHKFRFYRQSFSDVYVTGEEMLSGARIV